MSTQWLLMTNLFHSNNVISIVIRTKCKYLIQLVIFLHDEIFRHFSIIAACHFNDFHIFQIIYQYIFIYFYGNISRVLTGPFYVSIWISAPFFISSRTSALFFISTKHANISFMAPYYGFAFQKFSCRYVFILTCLSLSATILRRPPFSLLD